LAKQYGIKESTRSVLTQKLEQIWGILNANSQEPNYITDHPTLISEFIQKNREMYKKVLRYEVSCA
jgi:lysyl-tRNA synthetase class II